MGTKFIYNNKNLQNIKDNINDSIINPIEESHRNISKILEELSEDNLAWQGG